MQPAREIHVSVCYLPHHEQVVLRPKQILTCSHALGPSYNKISFLLMERIPESLNANGKESTPAPMAELHSVKTDDMDELPSSSSEIRILTSGL